MARPGCTMDQRVGRKRGLREFGRARLQVQGGVGEASGARALPGGVSWYRRGSEVLYAAPSKGGVCRAIEQGGRILRSCSRGLQSYRPQMPSLLVF